MTRSIYLSRHGQRIDDINKHWYDDDDDRTDPYLSQKGYWQAAQLGKRYKEEPIDVIFSSPFVRALQTAQAIAAALDMPFYVEAGLSEWHSRSLMPTKPRLPHITERAAKFANLDTSHESLHYPQYPETRQQVEDRYRRTVDSLLATQRGNLLLVGHGKVVTGVSKVMTGQPERNFNYDHACLTKLIRTDNEWTIDINGDTEHLNQEETPHCV